MKSFNSFLLVIVFLLLAGVNYAQGDKKLEYEAQKNIIIEQRITNIAEALEDETADFTTLFDLLSSYYERPINLNKKEIKEALLELQLLTEFQINNLLAHVKTNGHLMSIYELQSIKGFDPASIRKIMPFVTVNSELNSPHTSFRELIDNSSNTIFMRYSRILEKQKGYADVSDEDWMESENKKYLGSQDKFYLRYRFKYMTNVSFGFTAEKDAGESFMGNKKATELFGLQQKKGFDYYSAHFYLKNVGKIKGLAIGDYHMQLGQGLTFWSGLAFGKSVDIMTYKRNARGIKPYASVDENNFLRGAAITLQSLKHFEFTAFGSRKKIDANLDESVDTTVNNYDGVSTFTSFQATGNHYTVSSLKDKNLLEETYMGGNVKYFNDNFRLGITGVYSSFGGNIERKLAAYSQFQFNTNKNTVIGTDYSYIYKNFNVYGELSRSENGGVAQLHGLLASLDPKLSTSIVYRNYQNNYQSLRSNAFAESSTNINEKGLIFGLEAKPNRFWTITGYMDQFKFPWLRYLTDKPNTFGKDGMLQVKWKPSKKLEMYGRIRNKVKPKNTPFDFDDISTIVKENSWYYRYHISYKISESIHLKNRAEFRTYKRGDRKQENGYLIYQDITYKPMSKPYSFTFRYALFETDSYNARIYAYESNVLYAYSIPAYYNRGTRTQLTMRYRIKKGIDLWLRWAQWHYNDVDTIGTALEEIEGKNKTEIKAQLRLVF